MAESGCGGESRVGISRNDGKLRAHERLARGGTTPMKGRTLPASTTRPIGEPSSRYSPPAFDGLKRGEEARITNRASRGLTDAAALKETRPTSQCKTSVMGGHAYAPGLKRLVKSMAMQPEEPVSSPARITSNGGDMSSPLTAEIEAKMPIPLANLFSIETGEYAGKIGRIVAPLCYRAYGLRVLGDHGHLRVTCATMAELSKLAEDSGLKVKYI